MTRILLLGGTGAIGKYLQRACLKRGHKVFVTTRGNQFSSDSDVTYIKGNARDFRFVSDVLKGTRFDAVVDFMVYESAEFRGRVGHYLQSTGHYVFVSSYRVFSDTSNVPITETTPRLLEVSHDSEYLRSDEYALAKARQEDFLCAQGKSNWTIVRPSITYAENRLQFGCLEAAWFVPRAIEGLPVVIPDSMLGRQTTMTWAGDVAEMLAAILLNSAALGTDFNITGADARSWSEIGEIYRDVIGLQVLPVSVQDYLSLGLNRYQVLYDRMFDRVCDNTKIIEATGIDPATMTKPEYGIRESLGKTLVLGSSFSRLQGRMDALSGRTRLGQVRSFNETAKYMVGHFAALNKLALLGKTKKFAPTYKIN